ncbi:glycosyltransferase family 4 protein [Salinibacter ruber]|uniref:glycosyltransferase family 4 protein n=1 Tax=Salinibacter ruber TaxID=146919 RepID=UPI0021678D02|nr:glycosyltransferase family 4 protein [Salinibacter ruber]MCS3702313.1 glycosyltransferase involved in cell wall biosynthesis [Salinibacter ruber]
MPKVVHLTSAHSPTDTRIFLKECQSLAEHGYETVLVAPHDGDEFRNGVQIRAVRAVEETRLTRMTKTVHRVYKRALREEADLYHFHDPELIPAGIALRLRGKKVVYDVHEDLPRQILTKAWIPQGARRAISILAQAGEWIAARVLSGLVVVTPAILERFSEKNSVLVQNFPVHREVVRSELPPMSERPANVAYVGGIRAIRGIREMVEAVGLASEQSSVQMVLAGEFAYDQTEAEVRQMPGWQSVDYRGWVDRGELGRLFRQVRAGLVLYHPAPNHVSAQPNKLFEYMAAGLPVIASDFPLWREIVQDAECGLVVDPLDPEAIAKAIEWIVDHPELAREMGKRGRDAVLERYNWETEFERLLSFYQQILQ